MTWPSLLLLKWRMQTQRGLACGRLKDSLGCSHDSSALLGSGHRRGQGSSGCPCGWETVLPLNMPHLTFPFWFMEKQVPRERLHSFPLAPSSSVFPIPSLPPALSTSPCLSLTVQGLENLDTQPGRGQAPGTCAQRLGRQPGQKAVSQLCFIQSSRFWGEHRRVRSARNFTAARLA